MLTILRVYHYAPRKKALLASTVLPLLDELQSEDQLPVAFVTRHWDGGSHLALHLGYGPVAPEAKVHLGERVASVGGSGEAWSAQEYDTRRHEYQRSESRQARHLVPFPHGTVREEQEPDPAPLDAVRHGLLTGLTDVLREKARSGNAAGLGPRLTLQLMLAVGAAYPGGLRFGSLSYRSHAEAFLASRPDAQTLRDRFAQAYRQRVEPLGKLVAAALAEASGLPGHRAVTAAYARLREAELDPAIRELLGAADRPPSDAPVSTFHEILRMSGFDERPPAGFLPFRVLVNWLYEVLPVLDVTAVDRYLYCYCIARAVDEQLGESWQDRLKARPHWHAS